MRSPDRCTNRCPNEPTPQGMPLEVVAGSPRHRHLLEPGAQCCLEAGHEGAHRAQPEGVGGIAWHSPQIVVREIEGPCDTHPITDWGTAA